MVKIKENQLLVFFIKDVKEKIIGSDGAEYGPFKVGDIAKLPRSNAALFVEKCYCRIITKKNIHKLESIKPMSIKELQEILETTVKHDDINKVLTFFCMLTAYTEDSQFNLSFRAPSSTGKSYIPLEIMSLFPKEDVILIAYSSPTSFYHDSGEWDKEKKCIIINLERKIIIFLDQPHDQLLMRLRPLLSHDQKELLYKITDKKERKGLRTKNVLIRGFPSVIFCTGSLKADEQEVTRNILLSPETTQEKIRESLYLKALREGDPYKFQEKLKNSKRDLLAQRIVEIKKTAISKILVDSDYVYGKFVKKYPKLKPKHMRDLGRIFSIIKGIASFNFWSHDRDENNNITATKEDIDEAFRIWDELGESQDLGIPPYIYRLFKEVIEPIVKDGASRRDISQKHYEVYGRPIQDWLLRQQILPALESAGLIYQEPDPSDKRKMLIYVTTPPLNSL
ncbi:MAG: hypothetical protein COW21_00065 [Candidatus Aenigmarchaeota archaeon CG15_BIG_FIL_POST_REV_8_21_14_020_37_27]|nr:MAG: hypothetical protein COW21_00065 [Candidatus Aenigmarchaeota archaeon CG15_BIG_FIL_POST_REV_8_21_14_020_37_27]